MQMVDEGNVEFSNLELISGTNFDDIPSNGSMDSFFDELLRDTHACTHTHTCNPPGPDLTHTHTCLHVHTKIVPPTSEEKSVNNNDDSAESTERKSKKRGNIEAVRKYRQKKKAHAASLEEEVVKLRVLNQQLLRRLQGQAALEAEVVRLKSLLVDIRGRIDGEIGCFPYQRPVNVGKNVSVPGSYMIPCDAQCGDQIYCLHDGNGVDGVVVDGQGLNECDFGRPNCVASRVSAQSLSRGTTNVTSSTVRSYGNARRQS